MTLSQGPLLGEFVLKNELFPNIETVFKELDLPAFKDLSNRDKFRKVNRLLLDLLLAAPERSFLLAAVVDFINRLNKLRLLERPFTFALFEFWLNHFSHLSYEENYLVRAKIVGKKVPREDYQLFFPIGMGKVYTGSHFVTGHMSPDIDTTIASFWGWVDAFAARVAEEQHLWNLPGGAPESHVITLFKEYFGDSVFKDLSRPSDTLTLTARDILKQGSPMRKTENFLISKCGDLGIDHAIIYVDEEENFLGDWRGYDTELIRQVLTLFETCLRWYENYVHVTIVTAFGNKQLKRTDIPELLKRLYDPKIDNVPEITECHEQQREKLILFLTKVLELPEGMKSTFGELLKQFEKLPIPEIAKFNTELSSLLNESVFDEAGNFIEDRPVIFHTLEKIIKSLDTAFTKVRLYFDRLGVVMKIKELVFGYVPEYVTTRSDVEEIRVKMKNFPYLTVVIPETNGKLYPLGTIEASDLRKTILGTVTLRDFCNHEEIKMASYLEVISVIDHHKTALSTISPPLAIIGDAQSCNVIVAEQAFELNDCYSLNGMDGSSIEKELKEISEQKESDNSLRIQRKLLQRLMAVQKGKDYFIHVNRELSEYFCFLHAILDDTDLLTKVSQRDIFCIVSLLNRLKSLTLGREVEIIHLDDIPKDNNFTKLAAKRILQNPDMHSIYKKIYEYKEKEIETNLKLCVEGKHSNIFMDTKEQNGCCRVGQTKMFSSNFKTFLEYADGLRKQWFMNAERVNQSMPEIDLHMHMISTISSADEVYRDKVWDYHHQDELWIWVPSNQLAYSHLISFLNAFKSAPEVVSNKFEVEFLGPNAHDLEQTFARNFIRIPSKIAPNYMEGLPIAVLKFNAGSINSRKSMITPYLPQLIR